VGSGRRRRGEKSSGGGGGGTAQNDSDDDESSSDTEAGPGGGENTVSSSYLANIGRVVWVENTDKKTKGKETTTWDAIHQFSRIILNSDS
jgi:hypothetical protein